MFGSNPFGQSSSSPFGSPSVFGQQANNASNNPFAPKPFGSTGTFGSQNGSSIFGGTSTGVFGAQASSPLGSTSVFGASSSPAFGSSSPAFGASTTSAFGTSSAFGGSSAFGQKPAFGGFGASTTQTSPFGSSFQQSQPAFGSNLFGSTTPFNAQSQPAFGAASNPAFGGTSSSAFGASSSPSFGSTGSVFGGASSSPFGSSTPVFGASSPAFGATTPAFGATSSAFGATSIPAFGASSSPAFGTTSTPAFGASTMPAFGATNTPAFGASSSPGFGASSAPSFGFGSSNPAFGQSASAFGSSPFGTSPFGSQSSSFGTQTTAPGFGGQSSFGGQRGGSRVAPYSSTPEADGGTSTQPAGKLESISAMTVYKDKSHEELRWEDYQSGDKGGPAPAGQSSAVGFNSSPFASSSTPAFATTSVNPFSSSSSANPFASKTPTFSTGFGSTSTSVFGSSPSPFSVTGTATTSSPFGSTPSSAFGPSTSPSIFNTSSSAFGSPSVFGPSSSQGTTSTFGTGLGFGNTQSSPLFQSTTPTLQPASSPFGQTSSPFGQTTPNLGFGQPSLFNTPSTGFGGNMFSTSSQSNISPLSFGQTTPTLTTSFQSAQPTQSSGGFSFSTFGLSQPAFSLGGTPGILGSGGIGQPSGTPASVMPPAAQITNPFGSLPAMPQISISHTGTSPAVQYGISSLPVVEKPVPIRISSLLTSRHLSQRRPRLPVRKYNPKTDGLKVPFFSDEEETPSTPKADALFVPRENPRALIIRPLEQWSSRSSLEKLTPSKGATTPVHENGERQEDAYAPTNGHGTNDRNNLFARKPVENGLSNKEQLDAAKGNNGKANGANGAHDASPSDKGDSYITLTGHRAGEAAIVYEHGADIEALMPKLRHSDYYTEPRIQELAAKERADPGYCRHVKDFVVGRQGYGCIKFFGETDVRRLDLQSLVQFNNREVIVYMDESKKPPVGQGLNKPAEVTLLNVKCFDKKTGQQYTEGPRIEKYREMLRRKAEEQGAEFVSYDPVKGEWKFRVDHFSAYKLGDEDESAERDEESVLTGEYQKCLLSGNREGMGN